MRLFALVLILAAAGWRIAGLYEPALANFSPIMALTFCGGAYFADRRIWIVPFAALVISDFWIDHYYSTVWHYDFGLGGAWVRISCFAAGLGLGRLVSRRRSWLNLFCGILGSSTIFFLATNTVSWWGDAGYTRDAAGWLQAMTIGHPQYPPTIYFFRNTLASDVIFTGVFAVAMEWLASRSPARARNS